MTDNTLSEALKEAYASAPSEVVLLHTLELRHPAFVDDKGNPTAIRIVRDNKNYTCRLEDTAPLNPGEDVEFQALAFDLELPPVEAIPVPEITLSIDNVSTEIIKYIVLFFVLTYFISYFCYKYYEIPMKNKVKSFFSETKLGRN